VDLRVRLFLWWLTLSAEMREEVLECGSELPRSVAEDLEAAGVPIVRADMADRDGVTYLMPGLVAEFLDYQRTVLQHDLPSIRG